MTAHSADLQDLQATTDLPDMRITRQIAYTFKKLQGQFTRIQFVYQSLKRNLIFDHVYTEPY